MHAIAHTLDYPRPMSVPQPAPDLWNRMQDLVAENATLEREIRNLRALKRIYLRAANGPYTTTTIATVTGTELPRRTFDCVNLLESQGNVPVVRWARNQSGTIVGIEIAVIDREHGDRGELNPAAIVAAAEIEAGEVIA
jgi:hypothetical protein